MTKPHPKPPTTTPSAPSPFLPLLLLLFVGSGCAALIYEIVWLQLLQLVVGSTAVSLGVLLGTFMGGMCLGSLLMPRLISGKRHPLRVYALLELGIGLIGLAVLYGMPYVEQVYSLYGGYGLMGILLRGVAAGVCLLPPTLLMGATLPAVARWVETSPQGVSWLGFFYGGNIAGAVFGCLLAGFYLLRVYDMPTATYAAFAINLAVALIALALSIPAPYKATADSPTKGRAPGGRDTLAPPGEAEVSGSSPGAWAVYITIALSGMAALGAEVVWTRLLSLLLGGTVYTFSLILAVFLTGLGIGSSFGALLARGSVSPRVALGVCQVLLAVAIGWTALIVSQSLPYWPINPGLSQSPWYTFQLDLVRCLWAVLPPACLWGASFPLALGAVAVRGQDPGRLVGGVYAANTVGAIVGALAFSLLVVPWLGTLGAQRVLVFLSGAAALTALVPLLCPPALAPGVLAGVGAAYIVSTVRFPRLYGQLGRVIGTLEARWILIGLLVTAALTALVLRCWPAPANLPPGRRPRKTIVGDALALTASMGVAVWLTWSLTEIPWGTVAYGRYIATWADQLVPGKFEEKDVPSGVGRPDIFCTYVGEGMNVSVAVTMTKAGIRSFHGAGKVQASTDPPDMRLQRMLGHLPALVHPKPESVLVVACGAGVTAGSFVVHPEVKRIVICDIEPLVPTTVTPMFSKENYGVVDGIAEENPHTVNGKQVEVVYDDGRHFLRTTKEKFDIITSDPIDPWVKGCAALNTVEYYQMCKEHLNPGGVVALWIPLYESNQDTAKSVIATFFKVFPEGILWSNENGGEGYDAVLFAQVEPTVIDVDGLQQRLDRPDHRAVKESLQQVGFGTRKTRLGGGEGREVAVDLLATFAGKASQLKEWSQDAQINTDRNLRLQYLAGMWLNTYMGKEILSGILRYYSFPEQTFVGSPESVQALKDALAEAGRK
jgi:spermidine synthase